MFGFSDQEINSAQALTTTNTVWLKLKMPDGRFSSQALQEN
jgi:hypothetical protein